MIDEMTSVEFRKRYAKLTEPVIVTVQGHPIGTWTPRDRSGGYVIPRTLVDDVTHEATAPNPYREFRPAPKPGKR